MQLLLQSFEATAANLAADQWLLEACDVAASPREVLRIWQNPIHAVIVGRSSRVQQEVNLDYCRAKQIPVLRRMSGGAAVVIGPGCLMYSVVLDYRLRPEMKMLDQAHQYVMQHLQRAISACGVDVKHQGTCDLTLNEKKFSGNSLRCQRNAFLYHGTLMIDFDLQLLHDCLGTPPRQPDYRNGRSHLDFVTNLAIDPVRLQTALGKSWNTRGTLPKVPESAVAELARSRYESTEWTHQR